MKLANRLEAPTGKPVKTFRPFSSKDEREYTEVTYHEVDFSVPLPVTIYMLDEDNINERTSVADKKERLHQLQEAIEQDARHVLSLHDKYLQTVSPQSGAKGYVCLETSETYLTIESGRSDTFGEYIEVCVQDSTTILENDGKSEDSVIYVYKSFVQDSQSSKFISASKHGGKGNLELPAASLHQKIAFAEAVHSELRNWI